MVKVTATSESVWPAQVQIASDLNDCTYSKLGEQNGKASGYLLSCHLYGYAVGESRSYTF